VFYDRRYNKSRLFRDAVVHKKGLCGNNAAQPLHIESAQTYLVFAVLQAAWVLRTASENNVPQFPSMLALSVSKGRGVAEGAMRQLRKL